LACRYFGDRDLVEEMVVAKYWPLGKSRPSFKVEMVNLPIYGEANRVSFPRFGIALSVNETPKDFVSSVEQEVWEIVGGITDKEFLAQRAIRGTMPRLNRMFEELGIQHEEHKVPTKVLKSLDNKAKKAITKNTTATAEEAKGGWQI
jgi:hypothetical protein